MEVASHGAYSGWKNHKLRWTSTHTLAGAMRRARKKRWMAQVLWWQKSQQHNFPAAGGYATRMLLFNLWSTFESEQPGGGALSLGARAILQRRRPGLYLHNATCSLLLAHILMAAARAKSRRCARQTNYPAACASACCQLIRAKFAEVTFFVKAVPGGKRPSEGRRLIYFCIAETTLELPLSLCCSPERKYAPFLCLFTRSVFFTQSFFLPGKLVFGPAPPHFHFGETERETRLQPWYNRLQREADSDLIFTPPRGIT